MKKKIENLTLKEIKEVHNKHYIRDEETLHLFYKCENCPFDNGTHFCELYDFIKDLNLEKEIEVE